MRYQGGKGRVAKVLAELLEAARLPDQPYLEPFCGSAAVLAEMSGERTGGDINEDIILLLRALRDGTFTPPLSMSEREWRVIKSAAAPSPLRAFARYLTFGAKYKDTFARDRKTGRNYAQEMAKSLLDLAPRLAGATFLCLDYRLWHPEGSLIYCDPPYQGTTVYKGAPPFDHAEFWAFMRRWSERNTVFISEYTAPADFEPIWEHALTLNFQVRGGKKPRNLERLYRFRDTTQK